MLERRARMAVEGGIDWGFAELVALGSLVAQGVTVRLSGQDTRRGTFVQRHASIVDATTGGDYLPLTSLAPAGPVLRVRLAAVEFAAMGFEYG